MKHYYTLQEAADVLGCSTTTVYGYEKRELCKRIEDKHRLSNQIRFYKEDIDRLKVERDELVRKGKSVSEVASELNVFPTKVKEAIEALNLNVESVPTSIRSISRRFAINPEQEKQISDYLRNKKISRPKRNHLYYVEKDLALYQSFLIAGEDNLRLKQNQRKELGFTLENDKFIPYNEAIKTLDIEPRYAIHQPKQRGQSGFTDIVVPTGKKAFYQILDTVFAVCGVENFNAEIRNGQLNISVRNGAYPINEFATADALSLLKKHIPSGSLYKNEEDWIFSRTTKLVQLEIEIDRYRKIEEFAKNSNMSVKAWIHQLIEEKQKS